MIRLAKSGEENLIAERGEAERTREGLRQAFPSAGGIAGGIKAGQRWYLDDDDPKVVCHAYLEDDGVVYVDWVLAGSERGEEVLRFLANDLLLAYGDRTAAYPDAGTKFTRLANTTTKATADGTARKTTLLDAATKLNARIVRR